MVPVRPKKRKKMNAVNERMKYCIDIFLYGETADKQPRLMRPVVSCSQNFCSTFPLLRALLSASFSLRSMHEFLHLTSVRTSQDAPGVDPVPVRAFSIFTLEIQALT
jgi:hypothetical protein